MENGNKLNTSTSQIKSISPLVMLVAGIIYLGAKFKSLYGTPAIDFDYIWLSGKVWLNSQNPYDGAFGEMAIAGDTFKNTVQPEVFYYPFSWALPAMVLAELRLETATLYWRITSIVAMVLSTLLTFFAFRSLAPSLQGRDVLTTLGYLFLMQASTVLLFLGQTTWVVLLGLSLILYGTAYSGSFFTAIGLTFVLLKPNIGIPILATLAVIPRLWQAIAMTGVLSIVLAAPAFMASGVSNTVVSFLNNVPRFALHYMNTPANTTGIRNVIWELTKLDMNPTVLVGIASLAAVISTVTIGRLAGKDAQFVPRALLVTLSITLAIVPLHTYDFVIVAPFVLLFLGYQHASRWLVLIALAIMFRSDNIGNWTSLHGKETVYFFGSMLNSLASIPLLVGSIWLLFSRNGTVSASSR